jgi:hypothetical protein
MAGNRRLRFAIVPDEMAELVRVNQGLYELF